MQRSEQIRQQWQTLKTNHTKVVNDFDNFIGMWRQTPKTDLSTDFITQMNEEIEKSIDSVIFYFKHQQK